MEDLFRTLLMAGVSTFSNCINSWQPKTYAIVMYRTQILHGVTDRAHNSMNGVVYMFGLPICWVSASSSLTSTIPKLYFRICLQYVLLESVPFRLKCSCLGVYSCSSFHAFVMKSLCKCRLVS